MGIGDVVYVYRAGDVIPRVSAVTSRSRKKRWQGPTSCPNCEQPWDSLSVIWKCRTPSCSTVGRIDYAASREALDIDGLSIAIADALVESGKVADVADLFRLSVADLATLAVGEGSREVGTVVASKIHAQIQTAKNQTLARVITALGMRGTGRTMARRLATHFASLDALMKASATQLAEVDGIGSEKAVLIGRELLLARPLITKLKKLGNDPREAQAQTIPGQRRPFEGQAVVVTGSVPGMTRTRAQEVVEALGGRVAGSVSASTSLVVIGDGAGSKADKALQLGVKTMSAASFAKLASKAGL
jgi:DNA ligase (NAD+)